MSSSRRAVLLCAVVLLGLFGSVTGIPHASGTGTNKVALVVQHCNNCGAGVSGGQATPGNGTTTTECVGVPAAGTNALQVLIRSSSNVYLTSFQAGVSGRDPRWIDGDGYGTDIPESTFVSADPHWSGWTQTPKQSKPHLAQVLYGDLHVNPGTVVYYEYDISDPSTFIPPTPDVVSFRDVC